MERTAVVMGCDSLPTFQELLVLRNTCTRIKLKCLPVFGSIFLQWTPSLFGKKGAVHYRSLGDNGGPEDRHKYSCGTMMKIGSVDTVMGNYGIVLIPNKKLKVIFDQPFHLKMAVLDFNCFVKQESHFRVMLIDNNDDQAVPITLCILNKQTCLQTPLDLKFEIGDDVSFFVRTESNMNTNSFTIHLSGVTSRNPDDIVRGPLISLSPKKTYELAKPRSTSLPDEYFQNKRRLPSPLKKIPTDTGVRSCLNTPTTTSPPPTPLKKSARSAENLPLSPPNTPTAKKSGNWARSSFRAGGDLMGKLGKLLK